MKRAANEPTFVDEVRKRLRVAKKRRLAAEQELTRTLTNALMAHFIENVVPGLRGAMLDAADAEKPGIFVDIHTIDGNNKLTDNNITHMCFDVVCDISQKLEHANKYDVTSFGDNVVTRALDILCMRVRPFISQTLDGIEIEDHPRINVSFRWSLACRMPSIE